jgi:hypothetical protein
VAERLPIAPGLPALTPSHPTCTCFSAIRRHAVPARVMSKFLHMGFRWRQVGPMATQAPARVHRTRPKLGTLQIGAPADLSIWSWSKAPCPSSIHANNRREGKALPAVPAGLPLPAVGRTGGRIRRRSRCHEMARTPAAACRKFKADSRCGAGALHRWRCVRFR